jgi:hypothetical protein
MNFKGKIIHVFSKNSPENIISSDIFKNLLALHSSIYINPSHHVSDSDNSLIIIKKPHLCNVVELRSKFPKSTILLFSNINILSIHTKKIIDITVFYPFEPIFINRLVYTRLSYFIPDYILYDYLDKIQDNNKELYSYDGNKIITINTSED